MTLVASAFLHPERSDFPGERRYSTQLALILAQSGVDVRVVVPADEHETDDSPMGVEVVRLRGLRNSVGRTANLGQVGMLSFAARFVRTRGLISETDLVHSTIPLLAIDTIRHACPVVAFNHHLERVRSLAYLFTVPFGNSYGSYMYHNADAVVTPSNTTAAQLVRQLDVDQAKIRIIHHGIDTQTFFPEANRAQDPRGSGMRTILFVGSMNPRKNVEMLVRTFGLMVKADHDTRLVLVGAGPLDRQIDRLCRNLSCLGRVVRLGRLSDEELRGLYATADVFAWPSLEEGFGFAAVEAMACGAPVVALDTAINREIMGDSGILVPGVRPETWARAIRRVLDNPELADTLAKRGLRRVKEAYSWGVAATRYVDLFKELLDSHAAS